MAKTKIFQKTAYMWHSGPRVKITQFRNHLKPQRQKKMFLKIAIYFLRFPYKSLLSLLFILKSKVHFFTQSKKWNPPENSLLKNCLPSILMRRWLNQSWMLPIAEFSGNHVFFLIFADAYTRMFFGWHDRF